jgi:hypothetical protein
VRNTDRVSRDGELWEPVTQVPELIPEELLDLDTDVGYERFVNARSREDQREQNRSVDSERREDPDTMVEKIRSDWGLPSENQPGGAVLPWSLLGITLGALGVVVYLNSIGGM